MMLFYLLAGHAICDYPLQGDTLARGKNHRAPIPGIPWYQCLVAHALIQAGMVALLTGRMELAIAELIFHALIDFAKCEGLFNFDVDQALHVWCKLMWAVALGVHP